MKALMCRAFGPIETLRLEDVPSPVPGPGKVLIDVKAAAINFPDALIVQGLYQSKPDLPFSPGSELAGVVAAVGEGVANVRVGDRVIAYLDHIGTLDGFTMPGDNSPQSRYFVEDIIKKDHHKFS